MPWIAAAEGNPLIFIDPLGLTPVAAGIRIGKEAVAGAGALTCYFSPAACEAIAHACSVAMDQYYDDTDRAYFAVAKLVIFDSHLFQEAMISLTFSPEGCHVERENIVSGHL